MFVVLALLIYESWLVASTQHDSSATRNFCEGEYQEARHTWSADRVHALFFGVKSANAGRAKFLGFRRKMYQ